MSAFKLTLERLWVKVSDQAGPSWKSFVSGVGSGRWGGSGLGPGRLGVGLWAWVLLSPPFVLPFFPGD